jgi:D-alanyl-D-alanine dipeptidase
VADFIITDRRSARTSHAAQSTDGEQGFVHYPQEWWHFTLKNEPYPDTYFDFPIQ